MAVISDKIILKAEDITKYVKIFETWGLKCILLEASIDKRFNSAAK